MTLIQNLLADFKRMEAEIRDMQERLQTQAWCQLNSDRKDYEDHLEDLADGRPDSYTGIRLPKPMRKAKRYLFLTKAVYVCSDGRVICSEIHGQSFTEAAALEGRDPTLPPADFILDASRR